MILAGKTAIVEAVEQDAEDRLIWPLCWKTTRGGSSA